MREAARVGRQKRPNGYDHNGHDHAAPDASYGPNGYDHTLDLQRARDDAWVGQRRPGGEVHGRPQPGYQPPPPAPHSGPYPPAHPGQPHPGPPAYPAPPGPPRGFPPPVRPRPAPEGPVGDVTSGSARPIRSHGRRKRRVPIWAILLLVLGLGVVGAGLRLVPGSPFAAEQPSTLASAGADEPTPTPAPLPFRSADVTLAGVHTEGFLSWALMDLRSGEIVGSANMAETSTTASMIKAWLASDYLRLAEEKGEKPSDSRLHDLEILIRDSNNEAADRTYAANGKADSIERLISICGLTDSSAVPGFWSNTKISAQDTVRMGQCIANGTAAGPTWTPWVLDMMRKVRDVGDFGIRKAFPADQQAQIAIKNGWLLRDEDNNWHTNCMAIGDTWVLSVLQRYPSQGNWNADFAHTAETCQNVATLLLNPEVS